MKLFAKKRPAPKDGAAPAKRARPAAAPAEPQAQLYARAAPRAVRGARRGARAPSGAAHAPRRALALAPLSARQRKGVRAACAAHGLAATRRPDCGGLEVARRPEAGDAAKKRKPAKPERWRPPGSRRSAAAAASADAAPDAWVVARIDAAFGAAAAADVAARLAAAPAAPDALKLGEWPSRTWADGRAGDVGVVLWDGDQGSACWDDVSFGAALAAAEAWPCWGRPLALRHVACANPNCAGRAEWRSRVDARASSAGPFWTRAALLKVAGSRSAGPPRSGLADLLGDVLRHCAAAGERVRGVALVSRNGQLASALRAIVGDVPLHVVAPPTKKRPGGALENKGERP